MYFLGLVLLVMMAALVVDILSTHAAVPLMPSDALAEHFSTTSVSGR
nr:hypothetical protein [Rhodoferax sp.]